jgi:hypothetical protein
MKLMLCYYCKLFLPGPSSSFLCTWDLAIVVFLGMTTVHALSKLGVSDFRLLLQDLCGNMLEYFLLCMLWRRKWICEVNLCPMLQS